MLDSATLPLPSCVHPPIPRSDTLTYLRALDPTESQYCFRTFPERLQIDLQPAPAKNLYCAGLSYFSSTTFSRLCSVNNLETGGGNGIFITINQSDGRGVKAENINRIRAAFIELDHGSLDDTHYEELVEKFGASCIVESSPGKAHVYWYTNLPNDSVSSEDIFPLDKFSVVQGLLQFHFQHLVPGTQSKDLPRVLRVPGFYHLKDPKNPWLCRLVHCDGTARYDIDTLLLRCGITDEVIYKFQQFARTGGSATFSGVVSDDGTGTYLGVKDGARNEALYHYCLKYLFQHRGLNFDEAYATLLVVNKKNEPPVEASEVYQIAVSALTRFQELHGGRSAIVPGEATSVFGAWKAEHPKELRYERDPVDENADPVVFPSISSLPLFDPDFAYDYSAFTFSSPTSDIAIVERIVQRYGNILLYNSARGMHLYDNRRWIHELSLGVDTSAKIHELILPVVTSVALENSVISVMTDKNGAVNLAKLNSFKHRLGSATTFRSIDKLLPLRSELYADPETFDADDSLLGVENGVVSMPHQKLLPHSPDYRLTKIAPVRWSAASECPTFDSFLQAFTCEDDDLVAYLWRMMGYLISGQISEQVLFFLYGTGANGKSRFCEVLYDLLGGDYATYIPAGTLVGSMNRIGDRGESPSPNLVNLIGKRLAICMEIDQDQEWHEATIKDLTSDEPITARGLRRDPITFRPKVKIVVRSNHMPIVRGTDDGIWRRFHPIPCDLRVPKKSQDTRLRQKLKDELPGILRKAVRGYIEWTEQGLNPPARVHDASEKYQRINSPVRYFVLTFCIPAEEMSTTRGGFELLYPRPVSAAELFQAYQTWASLQEGTLVKEGNPKTTTEMGKELRALGLNRVSYRIEGKVTKLYPLYITTAFMND